MQVYLIRHGSTAGNLERRYVGTTDEALTDEAVEELRAARARYPAPDCVFISPMKRCVQTAGLLFPELEPVALADLRECDFGTFEYKNYHELEGDAAYQAWIDSGGRDEFPGGENREGFTDRCCDAFEKACRQAVRQGHETVAFVVHGGTIMSILSRYADPGRDYFDWQAKNGQGYEGILSAEECPLDETTENTESQSDGAHKIKKRDGRRRFRIVNPEPFPQEADPIGIEDQFVLKKNKKLRCGYTTGSCAAAAAKAAAEMLLTGRICRYADLMTPKGLPLHLPVLKQRIWNDGAECAVRKYGGDDPDATDGLLICARAEFLPGGKPDGGDEDMRSGQPGAPPDQGRFAQVSVDGGVGIGRVTRPGLEQPVGAAAINRVPREMIMREVAAVCEAYEYDGRVRITVSAPDGAAVAERTFNPHLGILGGISILGTSGIVVPMSEEALIASIRLEMQQKYANGERWLLVTPGNYGADFIRRRELSSELDAEHSLKCSNYVGETVDLAAELGFRGILFVAHIGKFIKVSGGIMNTHSAHADCRAELMAAQALRALCRGENRTVGAAEAGAALRLAQRLLGANTTEEGVEILREAGALEAAVKETAARIKYHLQKRCQGAIRTEAILFSNRFGYLGETDGAEELAERIEEQTAESRGRQQGTDGKSRFSGREET